MISLLTKLPLKTLSVFVFVAFWNPVLHQVQKAHLRQYQKLHKNTVNYSAVCKASANQVDTEHLQINLCHAKSRKVGPGGGGDRIYIYMYICYTPLASEVKQLRSILFTMTRCSENRYNSYKTRKAVRSSWPSLMA